jgi:hypothetical protein
MLDYNPIRVNKTFYIIYELFKFEIFQQNEKHTFWLPLKF